MLIIVYFHGDLKLIKYIRNYYFESVISYGFYPKITLPTRIDSREGINNPLPH